MKKIYIFAAMLFFGCTSAFSQGSLNPGGQVMERQIEQKLNKRLSTASTAPIGNSNSSVTRGTVIWSDNFGIPANWNINHDAGTSDWEISTTGPSGTYKIDSINSTSQANGWALFDSDLLCSPPQDANIQNANPIDLSGYPLVELKFEQYFRKYVGQTFVEVSNNGTTWTPFEVNVGLTNNQYSGNNAASNPNLVTLNISAVAGGQATVWIRFNYYSPTEGCDYSWQVDDVSIEEIPPSNNSNIDRSFYFPQFTMTPNGQQIPMDFSGAISNIGTSTLTNVVLSVDINGGEFTGSSAPIANFSAGSKDTVFTAENFLPPAIGVYEVHYNLTQDQADDNDTANADTSLFQISDTIYSRDFNYLTNEYVWNGPKSTQFGNSFSINKTFEATSATGVLYYGSVGENIRFILYDSGMVQVAATNYYSIQSTDNPTAGGLNPPSITLPFIGGPISLNSAIGTYLLMFSYEGTDTVAVASDVFTTKTAGTSFMINDLGTLSELTETPMVRLNGSTFVCTPLTFNAATIVNETCSASNGSAMVNVSNGTAPFTYSWNGAAGTASMDSLGAGDYIVSVTDANGCVGTDTASITNSVAATLSFSSTENTNCATPNGSATVVATGSSPFTYSWSNAGTSSGITGLSSQVYSVIVTDLNGCTSSGQTMVADSTTNPMVTLSSTHNTNCANPNGSATAIASGNGPFTYLWGGGDSTATITGLTSQSYSVTVTDINGCTASGQTMVADSTVPPVVTFTTVNSTCGMANGSVTLTATGNGPFTSDGDTFASEITEDSLAAMNYGSYDVIDANGCSTPTGDIVIANTGMPASISFAINNPTCGASNGTITATASGDVGPYSYSWDDGDSTAAVSGKVAGVYSVTVTTGNGCVSMDSTTLVDQSTGTFVTITTTNSTCGDADGSATVHVVSTGTYSVMWSQGAGSDTTASNLMAGNYTVVITDALGCNLMDSVTVSNTGSYPMTNTVPFNISSPSSCGMADAGAGIEMSGDDTTYTYAWENAIGTIISTTDSISNVAAGNYIVTVTDPTGNCAGNFIAAISDPGAPILVVTSSGVNCFGDLTGMASVSATGGTGPLTYSWSNGDTDTVISNIAAGVYSVSVNDSTGCVATKAVDIGENDKIMIAIIKTDVSCFGGNTGFAEAIVSGGMMPYDYQWASGSPQADAGMLLAGMDTVTVTDSLGCGAMKSVMINEPSELISAATSTDVSCFGSMNGSAIVSNSGGSLPYSNSWSNGGNTNSISSLGAGDYSVKVTDAKGCEKMDTVTVSEPDSISLSFSSSMPVCAGGSDGMADVVVSGGNGSFTYSWSNAGNTSSISAATAGTYGLMVTDAMGCIKSGSVVIAAPAAIIISTDSVAGSKAGENAGTIDISVSNGSGPYTFSWSNGNNSEDISGLNPGKYVVVVTDSNGCSVTSDSIQVTLIDPVGIATIKKIMMVSVYPNPATFELNVQFSSINRVNGFVKMISITGQAAYSETLTGFNGNFNKSIDLNGFAKGVYYLQVNTNEGLITKKVIIQ